MTSFRLALDPMYLAPAPGSTRALKAAYLQALGRVGRIGQAAAAAGVNRREPAKWRKTDPDFRREERLVLDRIEVDREIDRLTDDDEEVGDAA